MVASQPELQLEPTFDPDWILFQAAGLLAINKPGGIPVHHGTGHELGLAERVDAWARMNPGVIETRAGKPIAPLHRLDREASGVVLFGLTRKMSSQVQKAFAARTISKRYLAVVAGRLKDMGQLRGKVRTKLRGTYRWLPASLQYRRLAGDDRLSLVEVQPKEGRTHQIRSLFAQAGRPLAGDARYGRPKPTQLFREKFDVPGLLLHAVELELDRSILGRARVLSAPIPEAFRHIGEKKDWPVSVFDG
jgi:23S rRNA-/tRNA-specific pseudouridylate synthase